MPKSTLRGAAAGHGLVVGAAVDASALGAESDYAGVLAREYNAVTPENAMKWGLIHPERDRYDFAAADALVTFAQEHGMTVRGHNLVWHMQNPPWLEQGSFTRDEAITILHDHITTVVSRYRGRVAQWDVVNEAIADDGTLRDTVWLRAIGPDYIDLAFEFAHAADPKARLYYNDYSTESPGPKQDAVFALVTGLRVRGVPIDGVGFQSHIFSVDAAPSQATLTESLNRFAQAGFAVAITELDVGLTLPADEAQLQRQADVFRSVLAACLSTARCDTFVTWGFTDRHSWVPAFLKGRGAALPFDAQLQPKAAYTALLSELQ
jgi:endo-1,4-beta-xylanase